VVSKPGRASDSSWKHVHRTVVLASAGRTQVSRWRRTGGGGSWPGQARGARSYRPENAHTSREGGARTSLQRGYGWSSRVKSRSAAGVPEAA